MKVSYNKRADVLYVIISTPPHACRYVEIPGGVIARVDEATQQVVGVTIYNFMQRSGEGERFSIPEIGDDLSGEALLKLDLQIS